MALTSHGRTDSANKQGSYQALPVMRWFIASVATLGLVMICFLSVASLTFAQKSVRARMFRGETLLAQDVSSAKSACLLSNLPAPGYIDLPDRDSHLFYWAIPSRGDPSADPVVLWLSGGPGCSSLVGLFFENGLCSLRDSSDPEYNPNHWANHATVIYVDQPADVGLSYGEDIASNEAEIGKEIYDFLSVWFHQNPSYAGRKLFVMGESYAGHYVPHVASHILAENARGDNPLINLHGIAIGNGLTSPEEIYSTLPVHAAFNSYVPIVSTAAYRQLEAESLSCQKFLEGCKGNKCVNFHSCDVILSKVIESAHELGRNPYDIRKGCSEDFRRENPLCYDFHHIKTFIDNPETRKAIGARKESSSWNVCNLKVHKLFQRKDWYEDDKNVIGDLLDKGVRVLIYSGDADVMCNWRGGALWTMKVPWQGSTAFKKAPLRSFRIGGEEKGQYLSANGLTFMRVKHSGHMVPLDQPVAARKMVEAFMSDKPFGPIDDIINKDILKV